MSGEAWKILIVDGNAAARAELRGLLAQGSARRYEVVEVGTGAAGVQLCAGGALPTCVLLAHELPDMDALGVLAALRGNREVPPFPVVILAEGVGLARDARRALLRAGAMELAGKPSMNAEALHRVVESAVDRFEALDTAERGERALARERLMEAQLEAVIEAMSDGVVVFDMSGKVVLLNAAEARINGYASATDMKRDLAYFATVFELYTDDGRLVPVEEWPVSRVLRGETVPDWQLHARRLDTGQEWCINFSGAPVRDRDGKQALAVIITRDITSQKRAEEALRRSERRLSRMVETNLLGILYWDMSGGVHGANDAFLDIVGYTREDLEAGRIDWTRMTPPEYKEQDAQAVDDLQRKGLHAPLEKQYIRKDGSRVWILVGSAVIEGTSGVGFVLDITERKLAEEALRESEARARAAAADAEAERRLLDAILEAAPVGIVVANAQGKLLRTNPANERLWGPTPQAESVGEYGKWKGWWADGSARHGRLVQAEEWALARALRGEIARNDIVEIEPFDAPGIRRTMLNSGAPVRDAAGRIVGGIIAQMDITAFVKAEAARRESEARFRALADNMSQLAWIGDEKGSLIWYNQRWFDYTGTTPEEMMGWNWRKVHHPDHVERVIAKFRRHVETGETWEDTFPLRGKDGSYRWFLSRAQPIRDESGKVVRWFGTNTDITAQREAEEALREASRRKDAFLAMLAHELRNPLAPVRTAVHILRRVGSPEPKAQRAKDIIDRQVTHMARLIDDLLDVSRITRGKLQLRKERCDLAQIVRQTIEDYRANLESGGLSLSVSVPREPLWVDGDPTRLVQMVGNLLHNALRFTEKGGQVSVRAEAEGSGEAAVVTIADTGVGMDPELVARLFDPFSQADQGIDRSKGGLGLGLALTKGLVELHGGSVAAHSEGLGRGSTFTLRLPVAVTAARATEDQAAAAPAGALRVVIIEDNHDAAETLADLLSLAGHEVQVAHEGRAGIELARQARPEVVISDIGLPGGTDGYAVAQALRADPAVGSAFLIALSGYAQEEDQRRSREAGFDAHLAKPPDLGKLEAMLAGVQRRG